MLAAVRRLPFTLLMLAGLIGAGIYGNSHVGLLDSAVNQHVGHSVKLLFEGQLHRIFTSLLFTAGGWRFYSSLLMFAAAVGWVELRFGSRLAMLTFFGVHLATLLLIAIGIALPLAALGTHHGRLLLQVRDVGPSAGYYGCLGVAVAGLAAKRRNWCVALNLVALLLRLYWSATQLPEEGRMLSADLAHLIAFPLGVLSSRWRCRVDRPSK